jgi:DNA-binding NtrC family response regulator
VDVRVVTATHRDLEALIRRGDFREDLFFRISVFPLHCPTLAERREDIPALVAGFLDRLRLRSGRCIKGLTPRAMERLLAHSWPGNVRELRNAIDYAAVLCNDEWIDACHLPPKLQADACNPPRNGKGAGRSRDELVEALNRSGGRRSEAARLLGVSRVTLWKRMKRYGVDLEEHVKI